MSNIQRKCMDANDPATDRLLADINAAPLPIEAQIEAARLILAAIPGNNYITVQMNVSQFTGDAKPKTDFYASCSARGVNTPVVLEYDNTPEEAARKVERRWSRALREVVIAERVRREMDAVEAAEQVVDPRDAAPLAILGPGGDFNREVMP
jgi:hypothetical protein